MKKNHEWIELLAKEWNVSNTVAKDMLHAMYEIRQLKGVKNEKEKNTITE